MNLEAQVWAYSKALNGMHSVPKNLLVALSFIAGRGELETWSASQTRLADMTGFSRSSIIRGLAFLEAANLIRRRSGNSGLERKADRIILCLDSNPPAWALSGKLEIPADKSLPDTVSARNISSDKSLPETHRNVSPRNTISVSQEPIIDPLVDPSSSSLRSEASAVPGHHDFDEKIPDDSTTAEKDLNKAMFVTARKMFNRADGPDTGGSLVGKARKAGIPPAEILNMLVTTERKAGDDTPKGRADYFMGMVRKRMPDPIHKDSKFDLSKPIPPQHYYAAAEEREERTKGLKPGTPEFHRIFDAYQLTR